MLAKNRSISFPPECPVNTVGLEVSGVISRIIPLVCNRGTIKDMIDLGVHIMCYLISLEKFTVDKPYGMHFKSATSNKR